MPWPIGTNTQKKTSDSLVNYLEYCLRLPEYRNQLGNKGVKVIVSGQNVPNQLHIKLTETGAKLPQWMAERDEDDNDVFFWEEEWNYGIQICITETELSIPDEKITKVKIKTTDSSNATKLVEQVSSERDKVSALSSILKYVFNLNNYRTLLCDYGIFNVILKDENEMYSGTEYENSYSLTFNTYVYIEN